MKRLRRFLYRILRRDMVCTSLFHIDRSGWYDVTYRWDGRTGKGTMKVAYLGENRTSDRGQ